MLQSWISQLGAAAVAVVCLYALVFGGWRERFGGLLYLAAWLVSFGFGVIDREHSTLYLILSDAVLLQGLALIAWKSPHPWPKWAVAGQLLCLAMALATLFPAGPRKWYFLTVEILAGWGVLLALLLGTITARQARRLLKASERS